MRRELLEESHDLHANALRAKCDGLDQFVDASLRLSRAATAGTAVFHKAQRSGLTKSITATPLLSALGASVLGRAPASPSSSAAFQSPAIAPNRGRE